MSNHVQAAQTIPVLGTNLSFTSDSGTQWNGRWATANLNGNCSYSRVASPDERQAYEKDVDSYFDRATVYYRYG